MYVKFFVHTFFQDLQPFSKMRKLCSRLLFHQNLLINRMLTDVFILVNEMVFIRSNNDLNAQ